MKRGNFIIKRKLAIVGITSIVLMMLLAVNVYAEKRYWSFSVSLDSHYCGADFSLANPKDDNEQMAYVVTTYDNLIDSDEFYYQVRRSPSLWGVKVSEYVRIYDSGTVKIPYFSYEKCTKGTNLYLEANTDKYWVAVEGYWYS